MTRSLHIGAAADAAGVSAKMIRHYEALGLIAPAQRSDSGYRQYSPRDIEVLRFVRQSRLLGFSMAQIKELLRLWAQPGRASREVKAVAQQQLQAVEHKLRELQELRAQLRRLVESCHGDDHPACPILDELGAPNRVCCGPVRP